MDQKSKNIVMGGALAAALLFMVCTKTELPQKVSGLFHKSDSESSMPVKRLSTAPGAKLTPAEAGSTQTPAAGQDGQEAVADGASSPDQESVSTVSFPADDINSRINDAVNASQRIMTQIAQGTEEAEAQAERARREAAAAKAAEKAGEKAGAAHFQGTWRGNYSGRDSGRVLVTIGQDGAVSGTGLSGESGLSFALKGKVDVDGVLEATKSVAGAADDAVPFKGKLTGDGASGTWSGGTWSAQRSAVPAKP